MLPALFGENLFDEMFDDIMKPMGNVTKVLYGKHAKNVMKTDVRETEDSYDVDTSFENGILKLSLPKAEMPKLPEHHIITIE